MKYYFEGYEILTPFSITSNEPMFDADTINLKKQRASQNAQRWELSFNIATNDPTDILVNSLLNFDQSKTMIMPQLTSAVERLSLPASQLVSSTATSGASSVAVNAAGVNGILPKGYFIKFGNHSKIYLVTSDVDFSLSSTTVNVSIYPKLRQNVSSGTFMMINNSVTLTYFREINDLRGIRYDDGILASAGTINIVEAV